MKTPTLLQTGIVGTIVTLVCCLTPILVISLGIVGISGAVGWLDLVLLPAFAFFAMMTGYALWKRKTMA